MKNTNRFTQLAKCVAIGLVIGSLSTASFAKHKSSKTSSVSSGTSAIHHMGKFAKKLCAKKPSACASLCKKLGGVVQQEAESQGMGDMASSVTSKCPQSVSGN